MNKNRVGKIKKSSRLLAVALGLLALFTLSACALAQEKTAEDWYKKGQDLFRNGSFQEAVLAYDRAIELEPNNATLYIAKVPSLNMLAFITNNQSIRNESIRVIDRALQIDPKNPSAWEQKGSLLSQMQRYNESLEAYDKAIENISRYRQGDQMNQTEFLSYIWDSKSIVLWQLERYNESLEAVYKSVQIDPAGNYDAWAFKGELLASLGRYNESLQAFDGAVAIGAANFRPELESFALIKEGYVLMQMGRYEEANSLYRKIIDLNLTGEDADRRLANAWRGRGNALEKLGEYNESLQAFDRATTLNAESAPYAWTGKGDALKDAGRYDEAVKAYDRALELYPEHADTGVARAQKGKGDSLSKLGERDEALAAYSAAVEASERAVSAFNNATPLDRAVSFTFDPYPLDGEFWHNRALALHALGRETEAEESSAKAIEMGYRPKMVEAVAGSGPVVTEKTEMVHEDDAAFTQADAASAQAGEDWFKKGADLFKNQSYEEAIEAMDKVIEVNPKNGTAWDVKGSSLVLLASSMYDEAIRCFDKSLEINPHDIWAWNGKGDVLNHLHRYEDAIEAYNKALEIDPLAFGPVNGKSHALWMLGRHNESLKVYDSVVELAPHDLEKALFLFEKAHLLAENGDCNETAKALEEVSRLAPQDKDLWINGGVLLSAHLGKYEKALEYYERALQIDPSDGYAWYAKGEALKALGRTSEADAAFAKARELGYVGLAAGEETTGKPSGMAEPSIEELATRLLQATYPGSTELNEVQLLAGKLPEDMPVDMPIPDGARIIGSEIQEDKGIYIVLDVPLMPDQALDFYRRALPSQNWTETTIPGMDRGFVRGDPSITFCKGMKNPSITVTAHPLENSTDLRISISSDPEYSPCSQASFDDWLRPIPKLSAPEGARQFNEMMTGGGNRAAVSATLETEMNSSALEDHYANQLGAANWTRKGEGQSGPQSWSAWSTEDEGAVWNGFLIALDIPGSENQRFVLVQASLEDNMEERP